MFIDYPVFFVHKDILHIWICSKCGCFIRTNDKRVGLQFLLFYIDRFTWGPHMPDTISSHKSFFYCVTGNGRGSALWFALVGRRHRLRYDIQQLRMTRWRYQLTRGETLVQRSSCHTKHRPAFSLIQGRSLIHSVSRRKPMRNSHRKGQAPWLDAFSEVQNYPSQRGT